MHDLGDPVLEETAIFLNTNVAGPANWTKSPTNPILNMQKQGFDWGLFNIWQTYGFQ